jgi:preprotein translocase subunit YajC
MDGKKKVHKMTTFQKLIIFILISFGAIIIFFWRMDMAYKQEYERCKNAIARSDEKTSNGKYFSRYNNPPEECRKYL